MFSNSAKFHAPTFKIKPVFSPSGAKGQRCEQPHLSQVPRNPFLGDARCSKARKKGSK